MPQELMIALIGLGGTVLGACISFLVSKLTLNFNHKKLYAETVSSNRMEWINQWRANISTFLSCARLLNQNTGTTGRTKLNTGHTKLKEKMVKARLMITTRLNLSEDKHKLMYAAVLNLEREVLNRASTTRSIPNFAKKSLYIEELARVILKPEWERVKNEAKGVM